MPQPDSWVPVRWPAGDEWRQAARLDLLRGTPFNCLVVDSADDTLRREAAQRGLSMATAAELAVPLVPLVSDAVWPQIPVKDQGGSGGDHAGPTGNPWIDSNGWSIQLLQTRHPGKIVWAMPELPKERTVWRIESFLLAAADAGMWGARWPVTLDAQTWAAIASGAPGAVEGWKRLAASVSFFEKRRAQLGDPLARLGVCADYDGPNAWLAGEVLNLAARRLLPYRILERNKLAPEQLQGLRAVLWVEEKAPDGGVAQVLDRFVQTGGSLLLPASAAHVSDGLKPAGRQQSAWSVYAKGQGRVVVARQPWSDPFLLAAEAHLAMGRQYDVVRMWNAGSSLVRYSETGERGLAQVLNFAGREASHAVSLYVAKPHRTASLLTLDEAAPKPLQTVPRDGGVEVHIPPFAVYAAVEFGG